MPPAEWVPARSCVLEISRYRDIPQLDQLLRGPFPRPPRPPIVAPTKGLTDKSDRSRIAERAERRHRRHADAERAIRDGRLEHISHKAPITNVLERLERTDAQSLVFCLQATPERRYRSRVLCLPLAHAAARRQIGARRVLRYQLRNSGQRWK
jgi:hypothetical protein